LCPCIGSSCLSQCVHGAPIGLAPVQASGTAARVDQSTQRVGIRDCRLQVRRGRSWPPRACACMRGVAPDPPHPAHCVWCVRGMCGLRVTAISRQFLPSHILIDLSCVCNPVRAHGTPGGALAGVGADGRARRAAALACWLRGRRHRARPPSRGAAHRARGGGAPPSPLPPSLRPLVHAFVARGAWTPGPTTDEGATAVVGTRAGVCLCCVGLLGDRMTVAVVLCRAVYARSAGLGAGPHAAADGRGCPAALGHRGVGCAHRLSARAW
jgi:hypothetical protein